ncbi:hypothetical protein [Paenibacillus sedimenti]|uniref:Uncharacterized protein n=1 Tax=Paenibacillus sedimenti TaxID=2770274 RepID=A0A926KMA4_9BACL|nr:hypothetical protein [Paenibacillus sedimenti]MBD0378749.1 hypothetical protein [Paenibacillus sedimenti]
MGWAISGSSKEMSSSSGVSIRTAWSDWYVNRVVSAVSVKAAAMCWWDWVWMERICSDVFDSYRRELHNLWYYMSKQIIFNINESRREYRAEK